MEKRIQEEKEQLQRELYVQFNQYGNLTDEQMEEIIEKKILESDREYYLSVTQRQKMKQELFNVFRKLDVLSGLLEDDDISEIMVNGKDHIFIEKRGRIYSVAEQFTSEERLRNVIQQIVSSCNRIVNETVPIVDARLEDGSRVNVVLPPIALDGAVMTIRKFPKEFFTMHRLIKMGSITREAAAFLEKLVKAKYNIFISGGTGSGKTTFLNVLSNYIPSEERVITIEDSAELQIKGIPNLVRLETRNANVEGENAITMSDLIKSALRMRPEGIKIKKGKLKRKKKRIPIPHTFLQHILGNLIPLIRCEVVKIIEEADDLLSFFHSILHVEGILPINGICTQHSFPE